MNYYIKKPFVYLLAASIPCLIIAGCGSSRNNQGLKEARSGFKTKLTKKEKENAPVPAPPAALFQLVHYASPAGNLAAYVSKPPSDGKKRPAIIWIFGGFSNSIGAEAWEEADPANDQSASAYRHAGIIMMYPSLRGGNDNPGFKEGLYGEVDDVIAAADYLAQQEFVDPNRIYLGGHSTGGTLVLLVAESTDKFRGVFSFGPVDEVAGYGDSLPTEMNSKELRLRSPIYWLQSIKSPTYVFEGTGGNIQCLRAMKQRSGNALVHFHEVSGADHFNILFPMNRLIAKKIVVDVGTSPNIEFTPQELDTAMRR